MGSVLGSVLKSHNLLWNILLSDVNHATVTVFLQSQERNFMRSEIMRDWCLNPKHKEILKQNISFILYTLQRKENIFLWKKLVYTLFTFKIRFSKSYCLNSLHQSKNLTNPFIPIFIILRVNNDQFCQTIPPVPYPPILWLSTVPAT